MPKDMGFQPNRKNLVKEVVWSKTKLYIRDTVGWMSGLVGGLQNHIPRFESETDLILVLLIRG